MKAPLILTLALTGLTLSAGAAVALQDKKPALPPPAITGEWTGTWGTYIPEGSPKKPKYPLAQMRLDCKVVALPDGKFQATFEGECGRPYKYTIQMLGRAANNAVLFQGSADLGEKDGGVYDWIGRANADEFQGFYTSAGHVGTFRLTRPKKSPDAGG